MTLLAAVLMGVPAMPCSAFLITGDGRVLFGNNEDYWHAETRVWFVPATGDRHGVMFLGYDNGFPQGGLNDAGLAFDGFATGPRAMTGQADKKVFAGNPISEAMATCASVDEVITFLRTVDLRPLLTRGMLFFADASGDSVIIEGDEFVRKTGDLQVVTNFYQSAHDDDRAQCRRYAAILDVLEARRRTDLAVCTTALAAGAQRGPKVATLYSNVFDLQTRTIHLYLFHDFEHPVTLDLATELAKGERVLRLPELFDENPAFAHFAERQQRDLAQRIAERRGPALPVAVLDACAGTYRLTVRDRSFPIVLAREEDGLLATSEAFAGTDGRRHFHSSSDTEFFSLAGLQEVTLRLRRDEAGRVTGFTLTAGGASHDVERLRDDPEAPVERPHR